MRIGMDAGMCGYRRASPPTMRIIMMAYRKAPMRMRFRGDGMDILNTSEVMVTHLKCLDISRSVCRVERRAPHIDKHSTFYFGSGKSKSIQIYHPSLMSPYISPLIWLFWSR